MEAAFDFFSQLYEEQPPGSWLLVWTLEDRRSYWFEEAGEAASKAVQVGQQLNTYYQVALAPQDFGPEARCKAADTLAIPGLWADLDYGTEGHKKPNHPPTREAALGLVRECGLDPTLLVDSGHGLHGYWLFKEPWTFDSAEERGRGAELVKRWVWTFKEAAAARGWDVDSTFDLARVLRVPGTLNIKPGLPPRPVTIYSNGGPRYNPSDIEELPFLAIVPAGAAEAVAVGALILRKDAAPPAHKFFAFQANDPRFKQSVERKRRDLIDQSASAYDMSLAGMAVRAGWNDQEIANLLVFCRTAHGDDPKLRQDYYQTTIGNARRGLEHEAAVNTLEVRDDGSPPAPEEKSALLETLSQALKIRILRVVKITGDDPQYALETERGIVGLGPIQTVMSQERFAARVCAATEHVIPMFKGPRWRKVVQALADLAEFQEAGPEATGNGVIAGWLSDYLDKFKPGERDPGNLRGGIPVEEDGLIYICASHFRHYYLLRFLNEKVTLPVLAQGLRRYGAERTALHVRDRDGDTTRSYWLLPQAADTAGDV